MCPQCVLDVAVCKFVTKMIRIFLKELKDLEHQDNLLCGLNGKELLDESNKHHELNQLLKNESTHEAVFLSMAHSNLSSIPNEFLSIVSRTLAYLTLRGNNIGSLCCSLPQLSNLKVLDLSSCQINTITDDSFANLMSLEMLILSHNEFSNMSNVFVDNIPNLIHLDLSYNKNVYETDIFSGLHFNSSQFFAGSRNLRLLDLSYTTISPLTIVTFVSLPYSLNKLSVCHTSFSSLSDGTFQRTNLSTIDLSGNPMLVNFIQAGFLNVLSGTLNVLALESNSLRSLSWLSRLRQLKILHLQDNNINQLLLDTFSELDLLEMLDLSFNNIGSWDERIFRKNRLLKTLKLNDNNLNVMTWDMCYDLIETHYLTIGNNKFICSCGLSEFMQSTAIVSDNNNSSSMTTPTYTFGIQLLDFDEDNYRCLNITTNQYTSFTSLDICPDDFLGQVNNITTTIVVSVMVPIICALLGWLIYVNWWYIRYALVVIKNAAILSYLKRSKFADSRRDLISNDTENGYCYDVFVSYCDENRDWIINEFLPNIEKDRYDINVCLHERDFQVGLSILENIIACIDQSRCIFLVISKQFLLSSWCQFEMHLAQHRLIEARRENLVLILLEDIPKRKRSRTLHYLMCTKTYIQWPGDELEVDCSGANLKKQQEERKQFWKRLKRTLTDGVSV